MVITKELELPTVPIIDDSFLIPETIDELISYADGKSTLNPLANREGVVLRNYTRTISFKVISNSFLLKEA